jgi:hypothetical protein
MPYTFNIFTKKLDYYETSEGGGSQTPWTQDIESGGNSILTDSVKAIDLETRELIDSSGMVKLGWEEGAIIDIHNNMLIDISSLRFSQDCQLSSDNDIDGQKGFVFVTDDGSSGYHARMNPTRRADGSAAQEGDILTCVSSSFPDVYQSDWFATPLVSNNGLSMGLSLCLAQNNIN